MKVLEMSGMEERTEVGKVYLDMNQDYEISDLYKGVRNNLICGWDVLFQFLNSIRFSNHSKNSELHLRRHSRMGFVIVVEQELKSEMEEVLFCLLKF
jgi:hypothetical protein